MFNFKEFWESKHGSVHSSSLLRAFQWLNIILWMFLILYKFCIICPFETSSFIWHCHLLHHVHTGLLLLIIIIIIFNKDYNSSFSVIFWMQKSNFCLRVFFLCLKHSSFYITVSLLHSSVQFSCSVVSDSLRTY